LTEKYMTPHSYYDIAIEGQPKEQIYYHRSIQDMLRMYDSKRSVANLLNEGVEEHSIREKLRAKQKEQKQQQAQRKPKRHEHEH